MATTIVTLQQMTKDGQWRVRMAVFQLLGDLGLNFGQDSFKKNIQSTFFGYLHNTAAAVRNMGVAKSGELGDVFGSDWIV